MQFPYTGIHIRLFSLEIYKLKQCYVVLFWQYKIIDEQKFSVKYNWIGR